MTPTHTRVHHHSPPQTRWSQEISPRTSACTPEATWISRFCHDQRCFGWVFYLFSIYRTRYPPNAVQLANCVFLCEENLFISWRRWRSWVKTRSCAWFESNGIDVTFLMCFGAKCKQVNFHWPWFTKWLKTKVQFWENDIIGQILKFCPTPSWPCRWMATAGKKI